MTVGDLKKILEPMNDAARVFARDRDSINLEMIDIVNHPTMNGEIEDAKNHIELIEVSGVDIFLHKSIKTVYGGNTPWMIQNMGKKKDQAIIFCVCD